MTHREKAERYFLEGRNCAQAVFLAFCDVTGLDEETALKLSSSFGGGMGRMREVCGAVSGMFMVAGILWGYTSADDNAEKKEHYALIQELAARFRARHETIVCRDLLKTLKPDNKPQPSERNANYYHARPCLVFVCDAAEILDEMIKEKGV